MVRIKPANLHDDMMTLGGYMQNQLNWDTVSCLELGSRQCQGLSKFEYHVC